MKRVLALAAVLCFGLAPLLRGSNNLVVVISAKEVSNLVVTVDSPLSWLQVMPGTDPLFNSRVNEVVGSNVAGIITSVLPYSVVVTNNGSAALTGIDIRFSLDLGGRIVTRNFFYHSFGTPGSPLLAPGQSLLFTPLKDANAAAAAAAAAKAAPATGGGGPAGPSRSNFDAMRDLASAQAITVSVDLAVAADGRTAGPDKAGTLKKLKQTVEAYRTMRDECLTRLTRGDSEPSVQAWLTQISAQRVMRDNETNAADRYAAMQKQVASGWLGYLRTGKRSDLQAKLSTATPEVVFPYVLSLRGGLQ